MFKSSKNYDRGCSLERNVRLCGSSHWSSSLKKVVLRNFAKSTGNTCARFTFLDPRPQPEGSCEIGSVRTSFRLSVGFLGIGPLVFSETQHRVRGPYIVVCGRAGFFGKNPNRTKNDPKTWFLDFLRKPCHEFCLEFV